MKLDLHIHTKYSKDSLLNLNTLRKLCSKYNITPVITDHNTIKGSLKFKCKILAEEISTNQGEIIGLFLTEEVKPFQTLEETLDILKQQGALTFIPHPFDTLRSDTLKNISFRPDIIEVFNARNVFNKHNQKALTFANNNKLLKAVGSDAHTRFEIGKTYNIIEDFNSKKEFLKNLKKARFTKESSPLWIHGITKFTKILS